MKVNKRIIIGFVILSILPVSVLAAAAMDAQGWLKLMSQSMREVNYQGVFTYEHGAQMTSLQVFHAVVDGAERERLVHLDGEPIDIVRDGHQLTCVHPGTRIIRMKHGISAAQFEQFIGQFAALENNYHIDIVGDARIAGRDTVELAIVPKDRYRYAHQLFLDKETGLLLKSLLLDEKNRPLERFQFSQITIGGEIAETDLQSKADASMQANHPGAGKQSQARGVVATENPGRWSVGWVPNGYLVANKTAVRYDDGAKNGMEYFMYTDGLSAFTVFMEQTEGSSVAQGLAQRGATVAYSRQIPLQGQYYEVTVVGEVPGLTAEKVASSVSISVD